MSEVTRYQFTVYETGADMIEDIDGEWVEYAALASKDARINALEGLLREFDERGATQAWVDRYKRALAGRQQAEHPIQTFMRENGPLIASEVDRMMGDVPATPSEDGRLPPQARLALWEMIDSALYGTVEPMLRGDICNILAPLLVPFDQPARQVGDIQLTGEYHEDVNMLLGRIARQVGGDEPFDRLNRRAMPLELLERIAEPPTSLQAENDRHVACNELRALLGKDGE